MNYKEGDITGFNTHIHYVDGMPIDCNSKSYKYILELEKENKELKLNQKNFIKWLENEIDRKEKVYKEPTNIPLIAREINTMKKILDKFRGIYENTKN